jgi:hypothetical protein
VVEKSGKVGTSGVWIEAKTLRRQDMDVQRGLTVIGEEEVKGFMVRGKERIEAKFKRGEKPETEGRPML